MEGAGRHCSFCDQAQGVPGEAVTELKIVFNPKEICLCGHLHNNGAHVIRGSGGGRRVTFTTRCSRGGDARAALPGFGRRPVLLSLRLRGKVWLRPRQTFGDIHLMLFEKLLIQVVTVRQLGIKLICDRPSSLPRGSQRQRGGRGAKLGGDAGPQLSSARAGAGQPRARERWSMWRILILGIKARSEEKLGPTEVQSRETRGPPARSGGRALHPR